MRDFKILFISLFVTLIISCQATTEDAIKYNDGITEQQILVNEKLTVLLDSYDAYVSEDMDIAYDSALEQLNKSINYVGKLKGFEEDKYFKESALTFLKIYKSVLENEHQQIIQLLKLPEDNYGQKEVELVEAHRNISNTKIDKAFEDMFITQKKFADKYHIELESEN